MIVTIDGPAGAGKSTVSRALAVRMGFRFLDTGAMYRAITLAAMRSSVDLTDKKSVADIAMRCHIEMEGDRILLDGSEVTGDIRTPDVTRRIRFIADNQSVRSVLTDKQRDFARGVDCVTEGRDQGTEVFPDAECKIFLTASPRVRAQRRCEQLLAQGKHVSLDEILRQQNDRDAEDEAREMGALRAATDAVTVLTDGMI